NSKEQLEEMLRVAEDFYILNNIQINTAKSKFEKAQDMLTKNRAKG
ncbi:33186_t:CDS:2, partial [Gigaspora margarita]